MERIGDAPSFEVQEASESECGFEDLSVAEKADFIRREYGINLDIMPKAEGSEELSQCLSYIKEGLDFYGQECRTFVSSVSIEEDGKRAYAFKRGKFIMPRLDIPASIRRPSVVVHELAHARDFWNFNSEKEDKNFFEDMYKEGIGLEAIQGASIADRKDGQNWNLSGIKVPGPAFGFMTPYGLSTNEDLATMVEVSYLSFKDPSYDHFAGVRELKEFQDYKELYKSKLKKLYSAGFFGKVKLKEEDPDGQAETVLARMLGRIDNPPASPKGEMIYSADTSFEGISFEFSDSGDDDLIMPDIPRSNSSSPEEEIVIEVRDLREDDLRIPGNDIVSQINAGKISRFRNKITIDSLKNEDGTVAEWSIGEIYDYTHPLVEGGVYPENLITLYRDLPDGGMETKLIFPEGEEFFGDGGGPITEEGEAFWESMLRAFDELAAESQWVSDNKEYLLNYLARNRDTILSNSGRSFSRFESQLKQLSDITPTVRERLLGKIKGNASL